MKKMNSFIAVVVFFIGSAAFAQSDQATLNVILQDVQSITVNTAQETVNLTLSTVADYQNGINVDQADHLAVVSTSGFNITAQAASELTKTSEPNTIPVSTVSLIATAGSTSPDGTMGSPVFLSATAPVTLVSGASANLDAKYDLNYAVSGGSEYLNQPTGTYTTTITYSLIPQ